MNATNLKPTLVLIGLRIREIRQRKGLTQWKLAEICDMEKACMSRIENGYTNVTIDTLLKIAGALETTLSNLLLINYN